MLTSEVEVTIVKSAQETWELSALHCPSCGTKALWFKQTGGAVMYLGMNGARPFLCVDCGAGCYLMPNSRLPEEAGSVLAQLRAEALTNGGR